MALGYDILTYEQDLDNYDEDSEFEALLANMIVEEACDMAAIFLQKLFFPNIQPNFSKSGKLVLSRRFAAFARSPRIRFRLFSGRIRHRQNPAGFGMVV